MQSKYVVVEVANTQSTMTLVEYLVTHGYDKFAVVTDLSDHPSLKYKNNGQKKLRKGISINDIASALQKKSYSASQGMMNGGQPPASSTPTSTNSTPQKSDNNSANNIQNLISTINNAQQQQFQQQQAAALSISRLLDEKHREMEARKEQERQREQIQRIIMAQAAALNNPFGMPQQMQQLHQQQHQQLNKRPEPETRVSPELNDEEIALASETISKAGSDELKAEIDEENNESNGDKPENGSHEPSPSDEQVRASMIHLLNPVLGSAFGNFQNSLFDSENRSGSGNGHPTSGIKREAKDDAPTQPTPTKKHRWLPADELEESRNGRSKAYGRVHCKATYKCALCGKPTTLNSTGSRWNLLRHVIMIHSESKPYKCWDCDFIGIKSNVISHARQCRHRSDDANDITTDDMRAEWNNLLHECFPDYVKAKERGWQMGLQAQQNAAAANLAAQANRHSAAMQQSHNSLTSFLPSESDKIVEIKVGQLMNLEDAE